MKLLIIFLIFHISTKLTSATVSEHSSIGRESNDVSMQNGHKGEEKENVLENRNESVFEESGENLLNHSSVNEDKKNLEEIDGEEGEPQEIEDDGFDGKLNENKPTNEQRGEIETDLKDGQENFESVDRNGSAMRKKIVKGRKIFLNKLIYKNSLKLILILSTNKMYFL
jgi:hypothetical protein